MGDFHRHPDLSQDENISRTQPRTIDGGVSGVTEKSEREIRRCGFLVLGAGAAGAARLCDRPLPPGSSYCPAHRAGGALPPLPLADVAAIEPLEPIEEDDADRLAGLDLPRRETREEA